MTQRKLVPIEATDAQLIAGPQRSLDWMAEHGVDGLSPFKDYPSPTETLKVVYAAMVKAVADGEPATDGKAG